MYYGINKTINEFGVTNGSYYYFPSESGIPMPKVFFQFQGVVPKPPPELWLPL